MAYQNQSCKTDPDFKFFRVSGSSFEEEREITVVAEDGKKLRADKMILASRSKVLMKFELEHTDIVMMKGRGESVEKFLQFLYQGHLEDIEMTEHAKELLYLASFYEVEPLIKIMDSFISSELLTKGWRVELMELGFVYDLPRIKEVLTREANLEMAERVLDSRKDPNNVMRDMMKTIINSPNVKWERCTWCLHNGTIFQNLKALVGSVYVKWEPSKWARDFLQIKPEQSWSEGFTIKNIGRLVRTGILLQGFMHFAGKFKLITPSKRPSNSSIMSVKPSSC